MPNARLRAVTCLLDVQKREVRPKQSLESHAGDLDRRDRAFVMEILYGVLRYRDLLDWILGRFLERPAKLGDSTMNNLRIAAYQIFFMRVPDWAVVNESVELEKRQGKPSLVNAVLRNMIRKKDSLSLPLAFDDPVRCLSVNTSHPEWLIRRWIHRFGIDETEALALANNKVPHLCLRVNTLRITKQELLQRLLERNIAAEGTRYSPVGITVRDIRAYEELSFAHGLCTVQDEAAQLVSYLLAPKTGDRVLDACAAPGGKTTHIAQLMGDEGEIIAADKDLLRLERLEQNIQTLGIRSVSILHADLADLQNPGTFDRILLDAPCSSLGVIRRNPDVKYRHTERDMSKFRQKQLDLLRRAASLLRKKGSLVYSVCSIEPEEGEDVVHDFLKTSREFRIIDAEEGFLRPFMSSGFFRTWPHKHDMDGFFGAILCRQE